jgi:hypothetical protein
MKTRNIATLILVWILGSSTLYYFEGTPGNIETELPASILAGPVFIIFLWACAVLVALFIVMVRHTIKKLEE